MKPIIDTHTHTIASGHWTTDTATDLAKAARAAGIRLLCITDHSPSIPRSAKESYFLSLPRCPRARMGVNILYGVEADVTDENGTLGISDRALSGMDVVIASQHPPCFKPGARERNTAGLVAAIRSGKVDIVGHPDDEKYPLDESELVASCADYGVMIEMNNASLSPGGYRGDAAKRDAVLLGLCKRKGVYVALGSDSHGAAHVGDFRYAEALIRETGFPEQLVVNDKEDLFLKLLSEHKKAR